MFTLMEMSVVWHLYGGRDFGPPLRSKNSVSPSHSPTAQRAMSGSLKGNRHSGPGCPQQTSAKTAPSCDSSLSGKPQTHSKKSATSPDWKVAGGSGRDSDVLMEIELRKVSVF